MKAADDRQDAGLAAQLTAKPGGDAAQRAVPVAEAADADLVGRTRRGDLDAYAVLADRHGPMTYRVALRMLGNHQDAEDVAQEALVVAWQQLPGFRADASFKTWLYQIVTRGALNYSSRARAVSLGLPDDLRSAATEPAQEVERGLAVDAVTAAVAALPPPQRVAVVLHHFEGLPSKEIARITGTTGPAVRSHLFRGRRALTKTLADWK